MPCVSQPRGKRVRPPRATRGMTSPPTAEARGDTPCAPPAPIAASAAACSPRRTARAEPPSAAIPTTRPTRGGCAPRARRWARRWGSETRLLHPDRRRNADPVGQGARPRCDAARRDPRRARSRSDRLLSLGPAADRGLLRRQQAGEGVHRHAARRHQLAAVHGLVGCRSSPRLRGRCGAAVLRRPGAG